MKHGFFIFAMLVTTLFAHSENQPTASFHGMQFRLPSGWSVETIDDNQISVLTNSLDRPEVTIRRFNPPGDRQIKSHDEMIVAVKGLYSDMGILPETDVTLEYHDENRIVSFEKTCVITKTGDDKSHFLMLKCLFCNTKKSGQTLYLINYNDHRKPDENLVANLDYLFQSASITEPLEDDLYPSDGGLNYLYVLILLALAAFFFARNRRIQNSFNPLGRNSEHFWRCPSCRMINHNDSGQCRRCGTPRPRPADIKQ